MKKPSKSNPSIRKSTINPNNRICVVGGGAAGFFAGINIAENAPNARVEIFEATAHFLKKVKISGGGRCNVTHAEFDPKKLTENYPRGKKELLGPFHHFSPTETINWFEKRKIKLKTETDGRIFPASDSSQTIVDCFMRECERLKIKLHSKTKIKSITRKDSNFVTQTSEGTSEWNYLILATGSSPSGHRLCESLGLKVTPLCPSLFTFKIQSPLLAGLEGVSVELAQIQVKSKKFKIETTGPLLITHWGLSGPAVLKLSSFYAPEFKEMDYQFDISVSWSGKNSVQKYTDYLNQSKKKSGKKILRNINIPGIPNRLYLRLAESSGVDLNKKVGDLNTSEIDRLSTHLSESDFKVEGKSTHKEEFVTCGGVALEEIHFKSMESRSIPNLFVLGELLNIDAITGGFNFQNAWTGGWLASRSIATRINPSQI